MPMERRILGKHGTVEFMQAQVTFEVISKVLNLRNNYTNKIQYNSQVGLTRDYR